MSQGGSPTPLLPHLSKPEEPHKLAQVALPSVGGEKLTPGGSAVPTITRSCQTYPARCYCTCRCNIPCYRNRDPRTRYIGRFRRDRGSVRSSHNYRCNSRQGYYSTLESGNRYRYSRRWSCPVRYHSIGWHWCRYAVKGRRHTSHLVHNTRYSTDCSCRSPAHCGGIWAHRRQYRCHSDQGCHQSWWQRWF
jgi:hypothetical protein